MPVPQRPVALAEEQRDELRQMSVSRTLVPGDVLRARVILMLAEGRSYAEIQERLRTTAPTIARWKKRFIEYGVEGLVEQRSSARKASAITPELREQVIAATCRRPGDGSARWSCRALARELGISKDIVHRIWRREGLRPHRLERFMAPGKEQVHGMAADIVGLYLSPLLRAAVFCAVENSAAPAAEGVGPLMPRSPEREGFHEHPHGRLSLYKALSAKSSAVKPKRSARPANRECVSFLSQVLDGCQAHLQLTVILDRLSREDTGTVEMLLQEHPNAVLLLPPSHSAWLDHVEHWCSRVALEAASTETLTSMKMLNWKLMRHIRAHSKARKSIQWIYSGLPEGNRANGPAATRS